MTREALKKLNEKQMNYCKTLSALIDRARQRAYLHSMRASLTKDTAVLKARLTTGTRNF